MRQFVPFVLLAAALSAGAFALLGDDSISTMRELSRTVAEQQLRNQELRAKVQDLRSTVRGLQHSPRILEKAARNELGLARPNEQVFVFRENPEDISSQNGTVELAREPQQGK